MEVLILGVPIAVAGIFATYLEWWKWNAAMADRKAAKKNERFDKQCKNGRNLYID